MPTCQMRFHHFDARTYRGSIRWELFVHLAVRDVLLTPRADTLCVVFRGEPDFATWAQTLSDAGFPRPHFEGFLGDYGHEHPGHAAA